MTWLRQNLTLVEELLLTYLLLNLVPVVAGLFIALPLGRIAFRHPALGAPLLGGAGILYATPSLPLLIMIPTVFGTPLRSAATMTIALTGHAVALLVRTAADAFASVPEPVRQSATAIGFSPWARFWRVELPLAGPVLLAGVRVVAVSTVSLVTIGAVIGIRSLGTLFTDGFQRGLPGEVMTGLVLTVVLALALDGLCTAMGRAAMPWTRTGRRGPATTASARAAP